VKFTPSDYGLRTVAWPMRRVLRTRVHRIYPRQINVGDLPLAVAGIGDAVILYLEAVGAVLTRGLDCADSCRAVAEHALRFGVDSRDKVRRDDRE
jgi:hypothetical protein